jgi:hypothetical protein
MYRSTTSASGLSVCRSESGSSSATSQVPRALSHRADQDGGWPGTRQSARRLGEREDEA